MGLSSCAEVRGRRVRAEGEGFEFVRGGRGRRERGEYGFSSLLKQKIKGKNLLRHLQRRNFFFINFIFLCYEVFAKQKKEKKVERSSTYYCHC